MAELVYGLCALASLFCAALLVRHHRRKRTRLLLWSSLCFVGLAANNAILFVDLAIVPDLDLTLLRTSVALGAMSLLVYGLVGDAR